MLLFRLFLSILLYGLAIHGRPNEKSHTDKEVLFEDDDYDDDILELPLYEQKERLKALIENKIDANADGWVDETELKAWTLKAYDSFEIDDIREEFPLVDDNSDRFVTWEEHLIDQYGHEENDVDESSDQYKLDKKLFAAADVSSDGKLDFQEFVSFKYPRRAAATSDAVIDHKLAALDADGDGKISLQEFLDEDKFNKNDDADADHFSVDLDENNDGFLDRKEILKWLEPDNMEEADEETEHLMTECDTNKNGFLELDEILNSVAIWVESDATDFGRFMLDHDEL